jgi:hypothetical protein
VPALEAVDSGLVRCCRASEIAGGQLAPAPEAASV